MLTTRTRMRVLAEMAEAEEEESGTPVKEVVMETEKVDQELEERKERRRKMIITELFETEKTYLKHLTLAHKFFEFPLRFNGLITERAHSHLFSNLEQIVEVNSKLLEHMEQSTVGTAFKFLGPFLKLYSMYANNHQQATATLQENLQKKEKFAAFVESEENRPEVMGLKLGALLITPVQRIPRYKLLLEDLLENTNPEHHDYLHLKEAAKQVGEIANHINEHVRQHENFQKMLAIQNSFDSSAPRILAPGREFIKEGKLNKVSRRGGRPQERMFFLFSDMIMYGKGKLLDSGNNSYSCCCVLPLRHCQVERVLGSLQRSDGSGMFKVNCKDESLLLNCADSDEAKAWVEALEVTIRKLNFNRQTLRKPSSNKVPVRGKSLMKMRIKERKQDLKQKILPGRKNTSNKNKRGLSSPLRSSLNALSPIDLNDCLSPSKRARTDSIGTSTASSSPNEYQVNNEISLDNWDPDEMEERENRFSQASSSSSNQRVSTISEESDFIDFEKHYHDLENRDGSPRLRTESDNDDDDDDDDKCCDSEASSKPTRKDRGVSFGSVQTQEAATNVWLNPNFQSKDHQNCATWPIRRMPGGDRRRFSCVLCTRRTQPKERRVIHDSLKHFIKTHYKINTSNGEVICNKCRHLCKKKDESAKFVFQSASATSEGDSSFEPCTPQPRSNLQKFTSPASITLNIKTTPKTHARCIVCKKPGPKLIVIPASVRLSAFIDFGVLINAGSRCCPGHINCNKFIPSVATSLSTIDNAHVNRTTILNLLNSLRYICGRNNNRLNFDSLSEGEYINLTGLTKEDFFDICCNLDGKLRNTSVRSITTSVGIFLLKLKSGISNTLLATVFGLTKSSVRRAIASVRQALMVEFVPTNLGLSHISRDNVIKYHTRPLAQQLFGGTTDESGDIAKLILVLDGTYIYIQKSNNFKFQRRSYSVHKGRPLIKPMVVVTTTGYFLTIVGPFFADSKNNDANILNHMLKVNIENIKSYVKSEDVFIVDRGFRDSILLLEDLGIKAEMPSFMVKGQPQMSVDDANASRLVTKIRWIVESANARIKRFKFLDKVLPTSQIPFIGDFVRIACAISNKYFPPLIKSLSEEEDSALASHMKQLSTEVNTLKLFIDENHLDRKRSQWTPLDQCKLNNFPILTEDKLRELTCGVYQLKLSPSYIQEFMEGDSEILVNSEDDQLLCVRIQSRHISSKKYFLWLKYSEFGISAWYCKCRAGARVVGACSHVAAIIWYLSKARHESGFNPGVKDWGQHLTDASNIPEEIDTSDSDSDIATSCDVD